MGADQELIRIDKSISPRSSPVSPAGCHTELQPQLQPQHEYYSTGKLAYYDFCRASAEHALNKTTKKSSSFVERRSSVERGRNSGPPSNHSGPLLFYNYPSTGCRGLTSMSSASGAPIETLSKRAAMNFSESHMSHRTDDSHSGTKIGPKKNGVSKQKRSSSLQTDRPVHRSGLFRSEKTFISRAGSKVGKKSTSKEEIRSNPVSVRSQVTAGSNFERERLTNYEKALDARQSGSNSFEDNNTATPVPPQKTKSKPHPSDLDPLKCSKSSFVERKQEDVDPFDRGNQEQEQDRAADLEAADCCSAPDQELDIRSQSQTNTRTKSPPIRTRSRSCMMEERQLNNSEVVDEYAVEDAPRGGEQDWVDEPRSVVGESPPLSPTFFQLFERSYQPKNSVRAFQDSKSEEDTIINASKSSRCRNRNPHGLFNISSPKSVRNRQQERTFKGNSLNKKVGVSLHKIPKKKSRTSVKRSADNPMMQEDGSQPPPTTPVRCHVNSATDSMAKTRKVKKMMGKIIKKKTWKPRFIEVEAVYRREVGGGRGGMAQKTKSRLEKTPVLFDETAGPSDLEERFFCLSKTAVDSGADVGELVAGDAFDIRNSAEAGGSLNIVQYDTKATDAMGTASACSNRIESSNRKKNASTSSRNSSNYPDLHRSSTRPVDKQHNIQSSSTSGNNSNILNDRIITTRPIVPSKLYYAESATENRFLPEQWVHLEETSDCAAKKSKKEKMLLEKENPHESEDAEAHDEFQNWNITATTNSPEFPEHRGRRGHSRVSRSADRREVPGRKSSIGPRNTITESSSRHASRKNPSSYTPDRSVSLAEPRCRQRSIKYQDRPKKKASSRFVQMESIQHNTIAGEVFSLPKADHLLRSSSGMVEDSMPLKTVQASFSLSPGGERERRIDDIADDSNTSFWREGGGPDDDVKNDQDESVSPNQQHKLPGNHVCLTSREELWEPDIRQGGAYQVPNNIENLKTKINGSSMPLQLQCGNEVFPTKNMIVSPRTILSSQQSGKDRQSGHITPAFRSSLSSTTHQASAAAKAVYTAVATPSTVPPPPVTMASVHNSTLISKTTPRGVEHHLRLRDLPWTTAIPAVSTTFSLLLPPSASHRGSHTVTSIGGMRHQSSGGDGRRPTEAATVRIPARPAVENFSSVATAGRPREVQRTHLGGEDVGRQTGPGPLIIHTAQEVKTTRLTNPHVVQNKYGLTPPSVLRTPRVQNRELHVPLNPVVTLQHTHPGGVHRILNCGTMHTPTREMRTVAVNTSNRPSYVLPLASTNT